MNKKYIDNLIPVETIDNKICYLDISALSLSELIKLRKELSNKSNISIRPLDAIIHQNSNSTYDELNFNKRDIEKSKQGYRSQKIQIKMKRRKR